MSTATLAKPARKAKPRKSAQPIQPIQPPPGVEVWVSPLAPTIRHWVELVDPERALFYKGLRPERQRHISDTTVHRYAGDMAAKAWPYIADAIRINELNELDDGQHRLDGIIQSGVPQTMLIVQGLSPDAITVMDTGRGRSFGDWLGMRGVPNHAAVSALTKRVWHWQNGNYGERGVLRDPNGLFQYHQPSNPQLTAVYLPMESELIESAKRGLAVAPPFRGNVTPAVLSFTWLYLGRLDVDLREGFFHAIVEGNGSHNASDPIRMFRHRATQRRPQTEKRLRDWVWQHYLTQAYNGWVQSQPGKLQPPKIVRPDKMAYFHDTLADTRPEGWQPL